MQSAKQRPAINWAYFLKRPRPPTPEQLAERKRILAEYLASRK